MALPDFKKTEQNKTVIPEWAKYMKEGEFISYSTTYPSKIYFELFDEYSYSCEESGDIKYYVYDPVKHGADPDGKYPVLMWLHGASNSLMGVGCIMCCGAEQYASPKYQQSMGGAYIIVPLANEERLEDGSILGTWAPVYSKPIKAIYDKVCTDHAENIGKKFVMGASSGGYFTWQLLEDYGNYFDGAIPIASGYFPEYEALDKIVAGGVQLLIAHGRHDEMATFEECIEPHMEKLSQIKNCICFFPEWVYNGDGGLSSVFYGFEMGQHCMINWVQNNLMFDNGTPADERLPGGVTGWIRKVSL
ncbi:MAG: hypothetical protein IJ405_00870 [Lachnospiraceae bacterium]|nr:hypothetical protein [Lachnospiraceae bacterium]MBQ7780567.1 hypothetical protein [Lachnospiraceae bacterium]